jgi:hypothetical protein
MITIKLLIAFALGVAVGVAVGGLGMFFYLSLKGMVKNGGSGKVQSS